MAFKVAGEQYESITGQLFEIGRQLRQPNGYPFDPMQLKDFLQLAIEGKFNGVSAPVAMPEQIVLSVDYSCSLEKMIAAGQYDWTNSDITAKRFPVVGNGTVQFEAKLFHFDRNTASQDNVDAIKADDPANPWDPGKIEHLLSFGEKYSEEQRKYPIVALGSVAKVDGYRNVPYLNRNDRRRNLYLDWWDYDWDGHYRFLAVRKLSSAA